MGIIDELGSTIGSKHANADVAHRCVATPALLHSVAEGLRTGAPQTRQDCMAVMNEVAKRRPDLLGDFATDLFDAARRGGNRITRDALALLAAIVPTNPAAVFHERDYLLDAARAGGTAGLSAAKTVASLCAHSANYRGKLAVPTLRLLHAVADKDLARWVTTLAPAVDGSPDGVKRLARELEPRLEGQTPAARARIDKVLTKLNRSTARKR